MSDTLTYRGIASEAVFTEPPVVGEFGPACYPYSRLLIGLFASSLYKRKLQIITKYSCLLCLYYRLILAHPRRLHSNW